MKIEDAVRNTLGALLGEGEDVVKAEVVASPEDPSARRRRAWLARTIRAR